MCTGDPPKAIRPRLKREATTKAPIDPDVQFVLKQLKNPSARLTDRTVDHILAIVRDSSAFNPQSTLIYYTNIVPCAPQPKDRDDVQVLFGGDHMFTGHWITTYHGANESSITVLDSLGVKALDINQRQVLQSLYPFVKDIDKRIIYWRPRFRQKDSHSCGVFALSYMLSIVHGEKPEFLIDSIRYGARLKYGKVMLVLRRYLIRIVRANKVVPFELKQFVQM